MIFQEKTKWTVFASVNSRCCNVWPECVETEGNTKLIVLAATVGVIGRKMEETEENKNNTVSEITPSLEKKCS